MINKTILMVILIYQNILMVTIYDMSNDTIYEIQKYLRTEDIIFFSRTCKQLRNIFKKNL